jgi:hypothetical protein
MRAFVIAVACTVAAAPALAADLFTVDISSGGQTARIGFNSAEEAINQLETNKLAQQITYTGSEAVDVLVNFRGLPMTFAYPTAGSTQLVFNVPSLGINITFSGTGPTTASARDDAQDQLADYLKTGNLLGDIMKELSRVSPVDPIAGNPNSLQSQMVAQDFNSSFTAQASNLAPPPQPGTRVPNLGGIGLQYGSYKQADFRSNAVTLPLSYTIRSSSNPGHQLSLSVPLTMIDTEGATTYQGGLGLTYRVPLTQRWALAPSVGYAIAGSRELGAVAQMASGALTSSYEMELGSTMLALGNMIGYYQTLKFKIEDYEFDPKIKNTVFRNGLMWSVPMSAFSGRYAMEYSYINTIFTGTDIFTKSQNEFGLTFGTARGVGGIHSYLRLGVAYLYSSKAEGFSLNAGYWF